MAKGKALGLIKPDEEWRVEDDMRVLMQCREIEKDPKRMAKVRALAKKKLEGIAGVIAETQEAE
jgi:hypothetical protein